jgi:hypothetical protein
LRVFKRRNRDLQELSEFGSRKPAVSFSDVPGRRSSRIIQLLAQFAIASESRAIEKRQHQQLKFLGQPPRIELGEVLCAYGIGRGNPSARAVNPRTCGTCEPVNL